MTIRLRIEAFLLPKLARCRVIFCSVFSNPLSQNYLRHTKSFQTAYNLCSRLR